MPKLIIYTIFKTKTGYFTLAGTSNALCRTLLPMPNAENAQKQIRNIYQTPQYNPNYFKPLQEKIKAYYNRTYTDFTKYPRIEICGSEFTQRVLTTCRKITYGRTITYQQLAKLANSPKAARPAGTVMANNPLPLIIPCHRVIKTDGSIGNFSAGQGIPTKKNMLALESHKA